jgi:hypothetical protein
VPISSPVCKLRLIMDQNGCTSGFPNICWWTFSISNFNKTCIWCMGLAYMDNIWSSDMMLLYFVKSYNTIKKQIELITFRAYVCPSLYVFLWDPPSAPKPRDIFFSVW